MTNQYKSVWQSLPRHTWRLCAFGAVLGVSEAKEPSLQGLEHLEHMIYAGLSDPSAVIVREVKFREIGWGGKWGSVNVGCKRIQAFPVEEEIFKY